MSRTVYYVASSLDGFIATADEALDWLLSRDADHEGPMGLVPFLDGVGALAMGASTYEWIRRHSDAWEYTAPTWVFSHRPRTPPEGADVRLVRGDVAPVHAEMRRVAGEQDVWIVGGGALAGSFAAAGLLDEVVIAYAPVTLGSGAPLLPRRLELRPLEVARNGEFVCARWAVVKE